MKKILRYFSKSGLSVHALLDARTKAGEPAQRLQKIGKTRFGTYWSACKALEPCLTFIRDLVREGLIKFKVKLRHATLSISKLTKTITVEGHTNDDGRLH